MKGSRRGPSGTGPGPRLLHSIVDRNVCWRPGASRDPDVSRSRAWSSRSSRASGVRSRSLAAASSSASGSPSRRRQTSVTTASFAAVSSSVGARATNSETAGPISSGASWYSCSAAIRSGVLLVATTRSSGQESTSRASSTAAAATICSRLSRRRSALRLPRSVSIPSARVRPSASFTSSASASAGTKPAGSLTSAKAASAPSRRCTAREPRRLRTRSGAPRPIPRSPARTRRPSRSRGRS